MLDWRFFWLKNIQNWLRIRVKSCRTGAPNKLVQTHVPYSGILGNKITGGLANELGDEFLLAKEVDMFGLSSFPKWLMGIDHYFYHLLHNEMVAQASVGKQYYQVELQGGAGKKGLLGSAVPTKSDIRVWNYNTVLCGGKGTLYWQFGPELSGLESPGFGLFGFNGENTSRSLEASICAKELNNSILDNASRLCEENAIYVSRKVSLFCYAADRLEEKYAKSLCGVYRAAYLNGIPIRYFHEDQISSLLESSIKNLYVPMPLVLDKKEQDILFEFVNQGGNLILEAGAGLYDSNGEIDLNGSTLKKLAHLENKEIQRITEDFPAETKVFSGKLYRQLINFVGNDVEPNYFFGDSEYAVTTTKIGKGKTTWIGSFISLGFEENRDSLTEHFIINSFNQKGYNIIESLQITYYSPEKKGNNAVVIKLKEKNEAILININPLDGKVKILSEEL